MEVMVIIWETVCMQRETRKVNRATAGKVAQSLPFQRTVSKLLFIYLGHLYLVYL